jgi:hypothetical protein
MLLAAPNAHRAEHGGLAPIGVDQDQQGNLAGVPNQTELMVNRSLSGERAVPCHPELPAERPVRTACGMSARFTKPLDVRFN